jgi:hypothetical protein
MLGSNRYAVPMSLPPDDDDGDGEFLRTPTEEGSAMLPPELETKADPVPYPLDLDKEADGPEQAVFLTIGAASACWENLAGAGIFQSTWAKQLGDQLLEYLYHHGLPRE